MDELRKSRMDFQQGESQPDSRSPSPTQHQPEDPQRSAREAAQKKRIRKDCMRFKERHLALIETMLIWATETTHHNGRELYSEEIEAAADNICFLISRDKYIEKYGMTHDDFTPDGSFESGDTDESDSMDE